jgi:calreticulin
MQVILSLLCFLVLVSSTTYFNEEFNDLSRWVESTHRPENERGEISLSAGKCFTDEAVEKGLRTNDDYRFYAYSATFPEFSNEGKDLVLQYSVKHEQNIDCGGAYLKLHPAGLDQKNYNGDTEYFIMFGPDICGSTRRVHFIITHENKNHLINKNIPCETDTLTHVYTMILRPDNTYSVLVDGVEREKGTLEDDWSILPPRQINDPAVSKPSDWVDEKFIEDPEDKKPEGWDDIQKEIVDPEATKPDDWDDELDGEWEAPFIPNPEYKGEWHAKQIENPLYKGEWVHPLIDNPDFVPNPNLYSFKGIGAIGLEIWQVKAGTIFDNILVTDSVEEAEAARKEALTRKTGEQACEEEIRKKEAEEAAAAQAQAETETETDEEEEKDDL